MQLDSSFNLSQLWALLAFFWPRYAIFREPFFHRLTKKPNSPQFCYLSLAHHPIQCQHENFGCWGCPWLTRLIYEPPSFKKIHFDSNPRMEGRWKVPLLPILATCLVPSSVHVKPIFEAQQSDKGLRLCTHTHEAYSSTTWLFRWQKSIICLPTRGGGPEKGPAYGHLGTINPKISSINQPSRQAF